MATETNTDIPFDAKLLDNLMEENGLDIIMVTSKHNIFYLLGGYRFSFFEYSDAIGVSRYLPVFLYFRGRPFESVYVGNAFEKSELDNAGIWCERIVTSSTGTLDAIDLATGVMGAEPGLRVGIEQSFLPADACARLASNLNGAILSDAQFTLERLRAQKTEAEIQNLRYASDKVVESMISVFRTMKAGDTKADLFERMRSQERAFELEFEYCLVAAGANRNRAASRQAIVAGDIVSLDSGGRYNGYIGDLCRMGVVGSPDTELEDLLAEVDEVQQAARHAIRAGASGTSVVEAGLAAQRRQPHGSAMNFLVHGLGLVPHEAPRLMSNGTIKYPAHDAELPLQDRMILSIETSLFSTRRGFIKLEDTLVVRPGGAEGLGDYGRGWNVPM